MIATATAEYMPETWTKAARASLPVPELQTGIECPAPVFQQY